VHILRKACLCSNQADESIPWDYIWIGFQGIKETTYLKYTGIDIEYLYESLHRVYLQQALDYMNTHIKENIKINEIASFIGIDRNYLSNIFKAALDISPQE